MTTLYRRRHAPYAPQGSAPQARVPEAAHAATEIGAANDDDAMGPATGIIVGVVMALAAWLVIVLAVTFA